MHWNGIMIGRKGQGGFEYAINYGWAIIVLLIVGVAFWRIGVFSPDTGMSFAGFAVIRPQIGGVGLNANGSFYGVFSNGAGSTIIIMNIIINSTRGNAVSGGKVNDKSLPQKVFAGENFKVSDIIVNTENAKKSDRYAVTAVFYYTSQLGETESNRTASGVIFGAYE